MRTPARSPERGVARCVEGGCEKKWTAAMARVCSAAGTAEQYYSNLSDIARDTASVRVLTESFEKIRLTWDFTVSGEILRVRAMCLFEWP